MVEKIAINEFGEGNCCPECNSLKISVDYQFPLEVEIVDGEAELLHRNFHI